MKELDHVMKILETGGALVSDGCKLVWHKWRDGNELHKKITNTKPFQLHFQYCHIVDNHNNLCHAPLRIENTWRTDYWPSR